MKRPQGLSKIQRPGDGNRHGLHPGIIVGGWAYPTTGVR